MSRMLKDPMRTTYMRLLSSRHCNSRNPGLKIHTTSSSKFDKNKSDEQECRSAAKSCMQHRDTIGNFTSLSICV